MTNINQYISKNTEIQNNMFKYITDLVQEGGSINLRDYPVIPSPPNINTNKNNCTAFQMKQPSMTQFIFHQLSSKIANGWDKKGLMGWMSTGAGKTVVAAGIFDAFHNKKIVYYISRHDAIKPHEEIFKFLKPIWKNQISLSDFKKQFKIMSIASFSNSIRNSKIDLKNIVIIVDEAQYLFANRAVPALRKSHNYLIERLKISSDSVKTFILTATPGDTMKELMTLLNIISNKSEGVTNSSNYKSKLKDKIIYLDMYKDKTMFPDVIGKFSNNIIVPMENEQKERYFEKLVSKNTDKTLQKWSNEVYKRSNPKQISNKIKKIYEMIQKKPKEKHYIYSQYYKQGVSDLIDYLKQKGFERATKSNMNKKSKKYILAKSSENFVVSDSLNPILGKFNHSENKNGSYIQLFIATDSYNTGVDLKAVRHIHFMEPTLSFLDTIQGIGRGARVCSHKDLDKSDWDVNVYTYFSKLENKEDLRRYIENKYKNPENHKEKIDKIVSSTNVFDIDEKVYQSMFSSYLEFFENMNHLRTNAIDCQIMSFFHNQGLKKEDPSYIVCAEGNKSKSVYESTPSRRLLTKRQRAEIEEKLSKKRALIDAANKAKTLADQYQAIGKIKKAFDIQKERYQKAKSFRASLLDAKRYTNGIAKVQKLMDNQKAKAERAIKRSRKLIQVKKILNEERRKKQSELERKQFLEKFKSDLLEKRKAEKEAKRARNQEVQKKLRNIKQKTSAKVDTGRRKQIDKLRI